jgi:hypothetical protein
MTQLLLPFLPPLMLCNCCNARKETTAPCPACRCPEFRLVGPKPKGKR